MAGSRATARKSQASYNRTNKGAKYGGGWKPRRKNKAKKGKRTYRVKSAALLPGRNSEKYLEVYGNPFIERSGPLPRVTDPENVDNTTAFVFRYDDRVSASAVNGGNGYVVAPCRPLSYAGVRDYLSNIVPDASMGYTLTAPNDGDVLDGNVAAEVANNSARFEIMLNSLIQTGDRENWTRLNLIRQQCTKERYVASGIRLWDMGAADSQQGEIKGFQLKAGAFVRYVYDKFMQGAFVPGNPTATAKNQRCVMELRPFLLQILFNNANPNNPGKSILLYNHMDNATIKAFCEALLEDALQANKEFAGDNGESYILAEGVTQRCYTKAAKRPFYKTPWSLTHKRDPTAETRIIDPRSIAYMRDLYGPDWQTTTEYVTYTVAGKQYLARALTNAAKLVAGVLGVSTAAPTLGVSKVSYFPVLCTADGEPYAAVMEDDFDNQEADAGLMVYQFTAVGDSRPVRVERIYYGEGVVQGNSILPSSVSPCDVNFAIVTGQANKFPYIRKGHSFFSNLWDGLKKAGAYLVDHIDDITKIVTSGVQIGRAIAG